MSIWNDWRTAIENKYPEMKLLEAEPLSRHTSFRIGGPADFMAFPTSEEELAFLLRTAAEHGVKAAILGAGTNVLADDAGKQGLVICTRDCLDQIRLLDATTLEVYCGAMMAKAAMVARDHSLTGLEFAHGIPGTVGGGVFMNAGAYGGEIKQVAISTTVMLMDGTTRTYEADAQGFAYRHSAFQGLDCVILKTVFRLEKGDKQAITERMQELALKRRTSQPLDMPSAGSTFKRPVGAYAAALIDQCGLKGVGVGQAAVSEKHAGFVVNLGGATAQNVLDTIRLIQKTVKQETGFDLETEVKIF